MCPDFADGVGDAARFALWCPPIFRNRFNSDIEPCLVAIVLELSSCTCDKWSLRLLIEPNTFECFFSGTLLSIVLLDDLGKLMDDEELDCGRCLEPRAVNLNLESIASRFFDCGGRLLAAYGSLASPEGVNGLVYPARFGLVSREADVEAGRDESCVVGPIEKAPWCLAGTVNSEDRVVGAV